MIILFFGITFAVIGMYLLFELYSQELENEKAEETIIFHTLALIEEAERTQLKAKKKKSSKKVKSERKKK